MRRSSSPSEGLFGGLFAHGRAPEHLTERAWLQAMLDVEAALAQALAEAGLAPPRAAEAIAAACDAGRFDPGDVGRSTASAGTPVPGLVTALRAVLPDAAAAHVHRGATSQDVVDTAAMLVARRALDPVLDDLAGAAGAAARLAGEHRDTLEVGRTLLQQAVPVTFGLKAAGWLVGLDESRARLAEVRDRRLAAQLGGAVGTLAALGADGPAVAAGVARRLGLAEPTVPWHTVRVRPAELAGALGAAAGVLGKIGADVVLLAQTEVGEAAEGGAARGGSSTMPHKRNPVGAVAAVACSRRVPGLVATVLAAMTQEHERAAGAWQAEWEPLTDLLRLVGSAAAWTRDVLSNLRVDPARMRANVDVTRGLVMAESVTTALTPAMGRSAAGDLVERAANAAVDGGRDLRACLLDMPEVVAAIGPGGIDAALDPGGYLGSAGTLIDRALEAHRTLGGGA
jgi:3-carboxy-cis,cis-muconate cycloisomerase